MDSIKFKVISRKKRPGFTIIRAEAGNPLRKLTVFLDNETGEPFYPLSIEPAIPGVIVTLDSDAMACGTLPPSIPEKLVDHYAAELGDFHEITAAARALIAEEKKRILDSLRTS